MTRPPTPSTPPPTHLLTLLTTPSYPEAESLFRRLASTRARVHGPTSPDTLDNSAALALLLSLQAKHEEAAYLLRGVVTARTQSLGSTHDKTVQSVNWLAEVLLREGDLAGAERLCRGLLDGGVEGEAVLDGMHILAQVLLEQGQLGEAERVARRVVKGRERVLGVAHVDTLIGVHTLARVLAAGRRWGEAVECFEWAWCGMEGRLGGEHVDVREFLGDLERAREEMGKGVEGECSIV
ncbi:hypothetical protein P153DRAFT_281759 [Dothidotthia symphoricarpi CBS 119687]|uniref:TPR-like protein n=1 Tax=Dothidotthia symphoricarpi CBS 119687 TaxID=1392245 RepID=A0A6A6ASV6_9PLEO|nr:uncharacterized protein P153DRAFT_281759 [Dothidotthia symphoricarpi CBS 119687]KAF2133631.1 hypothetical protein P153DRAFT_281759 [Dothidotthia symphoricarpi CBS 119687]